MLTGGLLVLFWGIVAAIGAGSAAAFIAGMGRVQ